MKVVFVSNYFNHHQKPFSDAMFALIGDGYHFIETIPMDEERMKMGWGVEEKPAYVKENYRSEESAKICKSLIDEADVVMYGSAPYSMFVRRLRAGRLTFKYAERLYKKGCPYLKLPWHFYLNTKKYRRYSNLYLLCASAYTSGDFAKTFTFCNKAYKWGYFTETKHYDRVAEMIDAKQPASILWVARMIGLKHPEQTVEIASRLKKDGHSFKLSLIGNGELEDSVKKQIQDRELCDCVELLGTMKPEQVRRHMENSEIFLFTSDRNEGWGAVLNESMNSACAVIASHAIGSVPFLIKDGENGCIYEDGNLDELYSKVRDLLDDSAKRKRLARNAYQTIIGEWNSENAAKKLLHLFQELLSEKPSLFPYADGVCSKAEILKDNWKR